MKVLMICNYRPSVGGISGQVEALQVNLRREGHCVDIFSTRGRLLKRLYAIFSLFARSCRYDVLHIHCCSDWGFLPAVMGVAAAKLWRKHVVVTYHGGAASRFVAGHPHIVRTVLSKANSLIVLSDSHRELFSAYDLSAMVIPNIIELDTSHFSPQSDISPRYICTRAHEPIYNLPALLQAFAIVQRELPQSSLLLVGDGSQHAHLVEMASALHLDNVKFVGRVQNDEIYSYLSSASIFVSPSSVDNMPVSVLEAMNAGLFVIATPVGAVPDMLDHGQRGLLIDSTDAPTLAAHMLWPVKHSNQALDMIAAAHTSLSLYSWSSVRKQILAAYGLPA